MISAAGVLGRALAAGAVVASVAAVSVPATLSPADSTRVRPEVAVVLVRSTRCDGSLVGSGVLVDGGALTNAHVVAGAARVEVVFPDGRTSHISLVERVPDLDLVRLVVGPVGGAVPARLAAQDLARGEPAWIEGHPAGGGLTTVATHAGARLTGGVAPDPPSARLLDAVVVGGQSGSPVVDREGALAGIVMAAQRETGHAVVIDVSTVRAGLTRLVPVPFARCRS